MAEAFLGAVVGALLAIAAQWYLGPQVDRRVRAVERWEGFVIEFALLVDGPIRQAHQAARGAWTRWHGLYELESERADLDEEHLARMHEQDQRAFREALSAWGDALVRAEWLERQIVGDYSLATDEHRWFATRFMFYRHQHLLWDPWTDPPAQEPAEWERADEALKALQKECERISTSVGPPVGWWQRRRAKRRRRREVKAAAKRDAIEESSSQSPGVTS